jgi:hypothetical protein
MISIPTSCDVLAAIKAGIQLAVTPLLLPLAG